MDVVTGAFSFTGRFIAEELLARGRDVRTLTRRPHPEDPLAASVESAPLQFEDDGMLTQSLRGAEVLYNTYWIRFERGAETFAVAVENTRRLLDAAGTAGVRRVVHISVTNPSADSPLPYFRGKAEVERAVRESPLGSAIVRPTLVFGPDDILVNNIAWVLRRLPVFAVAGDGRYRVQPVSVQDVARLAVDAGERDDDVCIDAAGPETYTFEELVRLVGRAVGVRRPFVHAPSVVVQALASLVGLVRRDVVLTAEELAGLEASLLVSQAPATGSDSFCAWLGRHGDSLGRRYVSELARNYRHA